MKVRIDEIVVGERHRKDMGDIAKLAESIRTVGLLHPIVITPDKRLIAGERRLAAAKLLGWMEIPTTVIDLRDMVLAERAENVDRKDFTPSEAVAIGIALEEIERASAHVRRAVRSEKFSDVKEDDKGRAVDKVAGAIGMSAPTYSKAKEVVESAVESPELFGDLVTKMDDSGKVDGAYKEMKKRKKVAAKTAVPSLPVQDDRYRLVHSNIASLEIEPETVDVIITDPPYPKEYLPLYIELARKAAIWLKPGGSLLAMVGQSYLPEIIYNLEEHLTYHWTLTYLTPGGQAAQLWQRKVNTFWKPVLWFVKGEYSGDWVGDVAKSAPNDNDKRFHDWGQSESGIADLMERFTYPGQLVCDPFVGGGTVAVVALTMNRLFVGADIDLQAIQTTKERIIECLRLGKNAQGGATKP